MLCPHWSDSTLAAALDSSSTASASSEFADAFVTAELVAYIGQSSEPQSGQIVLVQHNDDRIDDDEKSFVMACKGAQCTRVERGQGSISVSVGGEKEGQGSCFEALHNLSERCEPSERECPRTRD